MRRLCASLALAVCAAGTLISRVHTLLSTADQRGGFLNNLCFSWIEHPAPPFNGGKQGIQNPRPCLVRAVPKCLRVPHLFTGWVSTINLIFRGFEQPAPPINGGYSFFNRIGFGKPPPFTDAEVTFDCIQEVTCIGKMQASTIFNRRNKWQHGSTK